ncbi:MAG: TonB-dependent receptor [Brevinematia bacterium]
MKNLKIILPLLIIVYFASVSFTEVTDTNNITNQINDKSLSKLSSSLVFEKTVFGSIWYKDTSISTIDVRKYNKKGTSSDILDYIQNIPDITTPTYYGSEGSFTTIFTPRGDKVDISINELNVSTMVNSSYDVNIFDTLFFDSLEIYYGPTSTRYGSGNHGGIVNFNLLGNENTNFIRVIRTIGTSLETYYVMSDLSLITEIGKIYLGVGYNRSENSFSYNISTLYTNYSSLEATNYTREGAEYTKYSFLGRYIHNIFGLDIDTGLLVTLPEVNEPNSVLISNPLNYEKAVSKIRFLLQYIKAKYSLSDSEIGLNIYYTDNLRNREVEKLRSSFGGSIGSKIQGDKFVTELNTKKKLKLNIENEFLLGASLSYSHNFYDVINTNLSIFPSTNTNETKTNAQRDILGLYLEGNYLLSSIFQLTLSSRFDYIEYNTFEYSPRIGFLFKPFEFVGIRSSLSRSYRLPYFDDIYGPVAYGYGVSPLTNLKTEYVNNIDLSVFIDYKHDKYTFYLSITPYYSDTTNLIEWNSSSFSTENIGKVFTRGINVQLNFNYKNLLKSLIAYTYNESINANASDKIGWEKIVFLNYRPMNSLYIDLVYDRGYFGFGAYLNYQWNRFEYVYDINFNIIGNRPIDDILTLSISHWVRPTKWVEMGIEWKRSLVGNEYVEGYPIPEEKVNGYIIFVFEW